MTPMRHLKKQFEVALVKMTGVFLTCAVLAKKFSSASFNLQKVPPSSLASFVNFPIIHWFVVTANIVSPLFVSGMDVYRGFTRLILLVSLSKKKKIPELTFEVEQLRSDYEAGIMLGLKNKSLAKFILIRSEQRKAYIHWTPEVREAFNKFEEKRKEFLILDTGISREEHDALQFEIERKSENSKPQIKSDIKPFSQNFSDLIYAPGQNVVFNIPDSPYKSDIIQHYHLAHHLLRLKNKILQKYGCFRMSSGQTKQKGILYRLHQVRFKLYKLFGHPMSVSDDREMMFRKEMISYSKHCQNFSDLDYFRQQWEKLSEKEDEVESDSRQGERDNAYVQSLRFHAMKAWEVKRRYYRKKFLDVETDDENLLWAKTSANQQLATLRQCAAEQNENAEYASEVDWKRATSKFLKQQIRIEKFNNASLRSRSEKVFEIIGSILAWANLVVFTGFSICRTFATFSDLTSLPVNILITAIFSLGVLFQSYFFASPKINKFFTKFGRQCGEGFKDWRKDPAKIQYTKRSLIWFLVISGTVTSTFLLYDSVDSFFQPLIIKGLNFVGVTLGLASPFALAFIITAIALSTVSSISVWFRNIEKNFHGGVSGVWRSIKENFKARRASKTLPQFFLGAALGIFFLCIGVLTDTLGNYTGINHVIGNVGLTIGLAGLSFLAGFAFSADTINGCINTTDRVFGTSDPGTPTTQTVVPAGNANKPPSPQHNAYPDGLSDDHGNGQHDTSLSLDLDCNT